MLGHGASKLGLAAPTGGALQLIVFDFDQTLSVTHVFKYLAGWEEEAAARDQTRGGAGRFEARRAERGSKPLREAPRPSALTERGQLRLIGELDKNGVFDSDGFAAAAFGGKARIKQLRSLLQGLKEKNVEMVVCTRGLIGAVRKCLSDVGLLEFFAEVYGNHGDDYGETPYDREVARSPLTEVERSLMGSRAQAAWTAKDKLICDMMHRKSLGRNQVCLVEDDPGEIRRGRALCRTVFVKDAAGMTAEHFEALRQMATERGSERPSERGTERPLERGLDATRAAGSASRATSEAGDESARQRAERAERAMSSGGGGHREVRRGRLPTDARNGPPLGALAPLGPLEGLPPMAPHKEGRAGAGSAARRAASSVGGFGPGGRPNSRQRAPSPDALSNLIAASAL